MSITCPIAEETKETVDYSILRLQSSASVTEERLFYSNGKRLLLVEKEKSNTTIQGCSYTSDEKKFIVNDIPEVCIPNPTDCSFQLNKELKKNQSTSLSAEHNWIG